VRKFFRLVGGFMVFGGLIIAVLATGAFVGGWRLDAGRLAQVTSTPVVTVSAQTPTALPTLTPAATMTHTIAFSPTTPTPVSMAPVVIKFDRGAYGKTFTDSTTGPKSYLLWAKKGQTISVLLKTSGTSWTSLHLEATGKFLYDKAAQGSTVTGTLPESGNYILTVFPGDGRQTSFELSVFIR
jgi:hypothetical protein